MASSIKQEHTRPASQPTIGSDAFEPQPRPMQWWDYLWISIYWFGITFMWSGYNSIVLPVLNARFVDNSIVGTALGLVTGAGMIVAIVVQPVAGALSDRNHSRWGKRRPFIAIGTLVEVVFLFGMMAVASWWGLLLGTLLLQLADNVAMGPYQGLMPDRVAAQYRGRASGSMAIAQIAGNASGFVVAKLLLLDLNSVALAFGAFALVKLLVLLPTLFLVHEDSHAPDVKQEPSSRWGLIEQELPFVREVSLAGVGKITWGLIGDLRRERSFTILIMSRLIILTCPAMVTTFALYYLQDTLKIKDPGSAFIGMVGVVILISLLIVYPASRYSDRIGRRKLIVVACIVGAVGVMGLAFAHSFIEVIVFGALLGAGWGAFSSIDWAYAIDVAPPDQTGKFMGLSNLAGAGSLALAGLLGGPVADIFNAGNPGSGFGYRVLLVIAALLFLLGALLLRWVEVRPHTVGSREMLKEELHCWPREGLSLHPRSHYMPDNSGNNK